MTEHAKELGYTIKEHRLFDVETRPDLQSELIIIDKQSAMPRAGVAHGKLACPQCHGDLVRHKGHLYCDDCCLIYPVIDEIPCLLRDSAVLGSKFLEL